MIQRFHKQRFFQFTLLFCSAFGLITPVSAMPFEPDTSCSISNALALPATLLADGKIKSLDDKGFGFIEGSNGDIFFHHSALDEVTFESLSVGQTVKYSEEKGPKGPRASLVQVNQD